MHWPLSKAGLGVEVGGGGGEGYLHVEIYLKQ